MKSKDLCLVQFAYPVLHQWLENALLQQNTLGSVIGIYDVALDVYSIQQK